MILAEAPHVKTVVVDILTFQRKRLIIYPPRTGKEVVQHPL